MRSDDSDEAEHGGEPQPESLPLTPDADLVVYEERDGEDYETG